jgi:hypothetical protein
MNEAKLAVNYFASIEHKCPDLTNPADYFMSMMSRESVEQDHIERADVSTTAGRVVFNILVDKEYQQLIDYFVKCYETSDLRSDPSAIHPEIETLQTKSREKATGVFYQWKLLAKRNFLNTIRLP